MSYDRIFMPTEEAVDELRKNIHRNRSYDLDSMKIELRAYCMSEHNIDDIHPVIEHIRFILSGMKSGIRSIRYKYAVETYKTDEDKMIWYCGWKYSHSECESDEESTTRYAIENLVNLACIVKTPDWFDDNEKFYDKLKEIDEIIEYYVDDISYCCDYEVIDKLKEFDVTNKDLDDLQNEQDNDSKVELTGKTEIPKNTDCDVCKISVNDYHTDESVTSETHNKDCITWTTTSTSK